MSVKLGSYKGTPTISLDAESKYPFTFGPSKARKILAHLDAIRAFVAANPEPVKSSSGHAPNINEYADAQSAYAARNGGAR